MKYVKEYKSFQQAMLVPSVLVSQRTERKCDFRFQGENGADLWPGSFQLPRDSVRVIIL